MMKSALKMAVLGFLAFFAQTWMGCPVDLLFLFTILAARQWNISGGVLGGTFCGVLASAVSAMPTFTVIFFYAVLGYIAALLLEGRDSGSTWIDLAHALLLSGSYVLARNSLFIERGITRFDLWNYDTFGLHALVVLLLLQACHYLVVDRGRLAKSAPVIESIVHHV